MFNYTTPTINNTQQSTTSTNTLKPSTTSNTTQSNTTTTNITKPKSTTNNTSYIVEWQPKPKTN
jgi:hypothetical protein